MLPCLLVLIVALRSVLGEFPPAPRHPFRDAMPLPMRPSGSAALALRGGSDGPLGGYMGEYEAHTYGSTPPFGGCCIKDNGEVSVNMVRVGKEVERVGQMGLGSMLPMFMNPQRIPWLAGALFLQVMVHSTISLVLAAGVCGAVVILEVASPGFITTFLRRRWSLIPG
jgi:hypothetical protein